MPSGQGLLLPFPVVFNKIPCGPPAAPPPEVPPIPTGTPSSILGGTWGGGGVFSSDATIDVSATGRQAGDYIVVSFARNTDSSGYTMSGRMPAGFVLIREDRLTVTQHITMPTGEFYAGLAYKISDGTEMTLTFNVGLGAGFAVGCTIVRGTSGPDSTSIFKIEDYVAHSATVPGAVCTYNGELVFVTTADGGGGGYIFSSASGLPNSTGSARMSMFQSAGGAPGTTSSAQTINDTDSLQAFIGYQLSMKPGGV